MVIVISQRTQREAYMPVRPDGRQTIPAMQMDWIFTFNVERETEDKGPHSQIQ